MLGGLGKTVQDTGSFSSYRGAIITDMCDCGLFILYFWINFTMQNLQLLELLAEAFRWHVHHFQYLAVAVELFMILVVFFFFSD